eukprot:403367880
MEHSNNKVTSDIENGACDQATEYYLPKPLIMLIGTFMKDYELTKMMQGCTYLNSCTQSLFKILYLKSLSEELLTSRAINPISTIQNLGSQLLTQNLSSMKLNSQNTHSMQETRKERAFSLGDDEISMTTDWVKKYAHLRTRQALSITSTYKLNPHEQDMTKNFICQSMKTSYGKQIHSIYQGNKLNACLSVNGELFITVIQDVEQAFRNIEKEQIGNYLAQEAGLESYIVPQNVVSVSIGGQDLAYIDEFGTVFSVSSGEDVKVYQPMKINIDERVKLVSVGLWCSFAVTESNKIYNWQQGFITEDHVPVLVQNIQENLNIIDIKSTNFETIFLTKNGEVYKIEHPLDYQLPIKAEQKKKLQNIIQISSSYVHLIALQRQDTKPIKDWDSLQVAEWFNQIGLSGCCNIIKFKKIDGEQILKADEEFLNDTLGMICQFEQSKFKYEISKVKEVKIGNQTLYGWGQNSFGQLGLIGANYQGPTVIPLPDFQDSNDYIIQIECGRRNTAILTKEGELWITGNNKIEKVVKNSFLNKKEEQEKESKKLKNGVDLNEFLVKDDEKQKGKKKQKISKMRYASEEDLQEYWETVKAEKQRKKKQKNHLLNYVSDLKEFREEYKKEIDKEKSLKHRWLDFTHTFNQQAFGKNFQIERLSLGNKSFVAICTYKFKQGNTRLVNNHKEGMKFQGADKIIKRLAYLQKQNQDKKYTICYEDRFLGLIETDLEKFMLKSEVPYHRIQLFKCNDEIIWDRKKKFTTL